MARSRRSSSALDLSALRAMAGATYWQRGEAYFQSGRVELLSYDTARVSAEVRGTESYRIDLRYEGVASKAMWACSCTCPLGEDGETCKHIVATALAWDAAIRGASPDETVPEPNELATFLREQPVAVLAALLLDLADAHADVRRSLMFWMRSTRAESPQAFRKALATMIGSPGFLDWKGSNAYARRLQQALELLTRTLARDPALALDGCEYALSRLLSIYGRSDDSGGAIGDRLQKLAALHVRICEAARPEPGKLAAALLKMQFADSWGLFPLAMYADALSEQGLDAYGARLQKLWEALPPPHPAARYDYDRDTNRFRITRLMEQYCEARGDVDALLKVKVADLSSAQRYADVINCCLRHGREKTALDWAERGVKAFKGDIHLRGVLAGFYERDGFDDDALKLRWLNFEARPSPDIFLELKKAARGDWPAWRTKALRHAEEQEGSNPLGRSQRGHESEKPWVGLRVQLHLAEGCLEDALSVASTGVADPRTLETLARAAEKDHAAAAVALYDRIIPVLLHERTGRYDDIVELIARRARLVTSARAHEYEAEIRARHRVKRNLIKALDDAARNQVGVSG